MMGITASGFDADKSSVLGAGVWYEKGNNDEF